MAKSKISKAKKIRPSRIDAFMALSDAEKEAVYKSVDREFTPSEMRPMLAADRRAFEKGRRMGRPTIGKGAKMVAITMERDLLKKSDAFAKQNHLKRSELFAAGVVAVMENPKLLRRKGAA